MKEPKEIPKHEPCLMERVLSEAIKTQDRPYCGMSSVPPAGSGPLGEMFSKRSGYRPCVTYEEARPFVGRILVLAVHYGGPHYKFCSGVTPHKDGVCFDIGRDMEVTESVFLRYRTEEGGFVGVPIEKETDGE